MILTARNMLLRTDLDQKQHFTVNGQSFALVPNRQNYAQDGKETNPVVAEIIAKGSQVPLEIGSMVLLHHNALLDPLYATPEGQVVPYDRWTMATIDDNGELQPTEFTVVGTRVRKPYMVDGIEVPQSIAGYYKDRVHVGDEVIGILKWGDYEVIYSWNGEERRRICVAREHIISRTNINDMYKPTGNHVLVLPDPPEKELGGMILPDSAQKKPKRGTVIAVGDGIYENGTKTPMASHEGDKVYYSKFAGTEIDLDGVTHVVVKEYPEILLIIPKEES